VAPHHRYLFLSECSVPAVLLHDSYQLEEEKIGNFFQTLIFSSFNLTQELNEKNNTLHCHLFFYNSMEPNHLMGRRRANFPTFFFFQTESLDNRTTKN
jgi:hypothetical protein